MHYALKQKNTKLLNYISQLNTKIFQYPHSFNWLSQEIVQYIKQVQLFNLKYQSLHKNKIKVQ